MKIAFIDIQNFRKLKCCRVELSKNKTVFVGANNSGKTSAMDALMIFLKKLDIKICLQWISHSLIGETLIK